MRDFIDYSIARPRSSAEASQVRSRSPIYGSTFATGTPRQAPLAEDGKPLDNG